MKKINTMAKKAKMVLKKHSPELFTIGAGVGVIATVIFVNEAAPKAKALIEETQAKSEKELTVIEKCKVVAPVYTKVGFALIFTALCVAGLNSTQRSRVAAATMADRIHQEFKKQAVEVIGQDKVSEIEKKVTLNTARPVAGTDLSNLGLRQGEFIWTDNITRQLYCRSETDIREFMAEFQTKLSEDGYMWGEELAQILPIKVAEGMRSMGFNSEDSNGKVLYSISDATVDATGIPVRYLEIRNPYRVGCGIFYDETL